jgi:hypothetical protein
MEQAVREKVEQGIQQGIYLWNKTATRQARKALDGGPSEK